MKLSKNCFYVSGPKACERIKVVPAAFHPCDGKAAGFFHYRKIRCAPRGGSGNQRILIHLFKAVPVFPLRLFAATLFPQFFHIRLTLMNPFKITISVKMIMDRKHAHIVRVQTGVIPFDPFLIGFVPIFQILQRRVMDSFICHYKCMPHPSRATLLH